jgi:hypothetical protein
MKLSVHRIFSMSAFEALRHLHKYRCSHPDLADGDLVKMVSKLEVGALDYEAARILDEFVPDSVDYRDPINFFRVCIEAAMGQNDIWVRSITLGRKKFIQKLERDDVSCFRCAQLLDDPPSMDTVAWWDRFQSTGREVSQTATMERARNAERLSLEFESKRLAKLGINKLPVWMSIEDNTVGYDVLSFDLGAVEPIARLIEVKSFLGQPRFYISRNEWNTAIKFSASYVFHIWDMQTAMVYERTVQQILSQIPSDGEGGRWSEAIIQLI